MRRKILWLISAVLLSLLLVFAAACGGQQSGVQNGGETGGQQSGSQNSGGSQGSQGGGSQGSQGSGSQGSQGSGSQGGGSQGSQGGGQSSEDDRHTYYTVTFDSQGGSAVERARVMEGNPIPVPASPEKEGFDFSGWYMSAEEGAALWDFKTGRVDSDLTLFAHWKSSESPEGTATLTFEKRQGGYFVSGDEGQAASIVIPKTHEGEPVVGIADSAFAYSKHTANIVSVTVPDSVTEIGKNAFHNQDALERVEIGENSMLEKIGNNAFSGNSSLKSIYLPAGLTSLGDDVFNNCGGLNEIKVAEGNARYSGEGNNLIERSTHTLLRGSNNSVIPGTVTSIGAAAFRRAALTTLTIPVSVVLIEKYAISDSAIEKIVYQGTHEEWENKVEKARYWNLGNTETKIECLDTVEESHILVAYFSATGTTKKIAEKIAEASGGTLYEIVPVLPYTSLDLNYGSGSSRTSIENNDPNARPKIQGGAEDFEKYDIVFLGYPIWFGKAPKIIYTFLESYDFSGKTIVPFCTSGSSPIGSSAANLHSLTNGATWLGGKRFSASAAQRELEEWIGGILKDEEE